MINKPIQFIRAWLIALLAMLYLPVHAQTTVQVGSGTGTNAYIPIYCYYSYNVTEAIYTAAEITSGGGSGVSSISKIRYYYANSGGTVANWNQ